MCHVESAFSKSRHAKPIIDDNASIRERLGRPLTLVSSILRVRKQSFSNLDPMGEPAGELANSLDRGKPQRQTTVGVHSFDVIPSVVSIDGEFIRRRDNAEPESPLLSFDECSVLGASI